MDFEDFIVTKEIIRAGATYPSAVPSSYSQPSENASHSKTCKKHIVLTSNRNTRLRPAFGATRDAGAVGPIESLSPYADAVDFNRRIKKPAYRNPSGRGEAASQQQQQQQKGAAETVAKGPTAETIISMTAAGKKPPVPESGQIETHKKSLLKISVDLANAVPRRTDEDELLDEAVSFDSRNTDAILSEKITGYHQTWSVAFSQENLLPSVNPPGPPSTNYPQNHPPGVVQFK